MLTLGDGAVGTLLVWSQVVLSLQLPFALWPLIRLAANRQRMGEYTIPLSMQALAWALFAIITAANITLIVVL